MRSKYRNGRHGRHGRNGRNGRHRRIFVHRGEGDITKSLVFKGVGARWKTITCPCNGAKIIENGYNVGPPVILCSVTPPPTLANV